MKASLAFLSAVSFCAPLFAQPFTQVLSGTGYYNEHAAYRSERPEAAPLRAKAQAYASAKCVSLFGNNSTVGERSAPKWHESDRDERGLIYREFRGDYLCTAGTEDRKFLLDRFLAYLKYPPKPVPHDLESLDMLSIWQMPNVGEAAVPRLLAELSAPPSKRAEQNLRTALLNTGVVNQDVLRYFLGQMKVADQFDRETAASEVRSLAASTKIAPEQIFSLMLPYLESNDEDDRRLAYDVLGGLGKRGKLAKPALWKVLTGRLDVAPPNAADALADIGGEESDLPQIDKLIADEVLDSHLKADLLWIAYGARKAALPVFLRALGDSSYSVRAQALHILPKIGLSQDAGLNTRILAAVIFLSKQPEFQEVAKDALDVFLEPEREKKRHEQYAREAEAAKARIAELEKNASVSGWVQALASTDVTVRWEATSRLEAYPKADVVALVSKLLTSTDPNARAGAMEFLRRLGADAKPAKAALFAMVRQFPAESEDRLALGSTLISVGIGPEDVEMIHALLALPGLHDLRRSALVQVAATFGPLGRRLVADLGAIIDIDLLNLSTSVAGKRTNPVDGDVYLATIALGKIGPSGEAAVDATIVARLKQFADSDDFNIPAWLRSEAAAALKKF